MLTRSGESEIPPPKVLRIPKSVWKALQLACLKQILMVLFFKNLYWSIGAKLARRNYGRSVREDPYSTFCCDFGLWLLDGLCNLSKEIGLHLFLL